jgi:hypothetical protein
MGMLRVGVQRGDERDKQKEMLRKKYSDYNPVRHDAFVARYNKEQDVNAQELYRKERGVKNTSFLNGRSRAQTAIQNMAARAGVRVGIKLSNGLEDHEYSTQGAAEAACRSLGKGWEVKFKEGKYRAVPTKDYFEKKK